MKKLILSAALATVLAAPAFAQSYDPDVGTGNIVSSWRGGYGKYYVPRSAMRAYAQAPARRVYTRSHVRAHAPFLASDPYAVEIEGFYVGRDPDPLVRLDLRREGYNPD